MSGPDYYNPPAGVLVSRFGPQHKLPSEILERNRILEIRGHVWDWYSKVMFTHVGKIDIRVDENAWGELDVTEALWDEYNDLSRRRIIREMGLVWAKTEWKWKTEGPFKKHEA